MAILLVPPRNNRRPQIMWGLVVAGVVLLVVVLVMYLGHGQSTPKFQANVPATQQTSALERRVSELESQRAATPVPTPVICDSTDLYMTEKLQEDCIAQRRRDFYANTLGKR